MENDKLMARFDIENKQNSGYLFARESGEFESSCLFNGESLLFQETLEATPSDKMSRPGDRSIAIAFQ